MSESLKKQLQEAIEKARNWADEGWKVTFGHREVEVNSLPAAKEMPKEFQHREEAIAYWENVKGISGHVTTYLEKALEDMENGNMKGAEDKIYFAQYFEKPLEEFTKTSKPVYESIRELSA